MNSADLSILRIFKRMQPLNPFWSFRRRLCMTLSLINQTRQTLAAASHRATKTRMEIREQDFSFNDDTRQRPLIEVVTKDVRTADIFNIMEAVRGEEEVFGEEVASWWKDAVTEEFSRQDIVLLALIAICALRLLFFVCHVTWKMMRLMMQWYDEKEHDEESEVENAVISSENLRKQLAIIRFCHLQFLLVVEKLQREIRESKNDDTQQMLASLVVSQYKDKKKVTLAEILGTLQKIQALDSCFKACKMEEHLADIKQDVEADEEQLSEAWERLQDIYASFLRIQTRIIRRQTRRKKRQWRLHQHEQFQQEETGRCQRRLSSSEDPTNEVLHDLQALTRELPQGFTADMFTSLGNAIHNKVASSPVKTKVKSAL
ncbi:unnamed protein product [Peronospora farinosa]|uniref:Uncharacterized protein n=1 Tax=Peronospora farinosa TaxID=134698 RepID=A0AAV0TBD3_9STRA|nr:unnamed protein product [Peronospora farinosa]CAI5716546.1 unnamed protein product [Peronospora farinosa]